MSTNGFAAGLVRGKALEIRAIASHASPLPGASAINPISTSAVLNDPARARPRLGVDGGDLGFGEGLGAVDDAVGV